VRFDRSNGERSAVGAADERGYPRVAADGVLAFTPIPRTIMHGIQYRSDVNHGF